MQTSFTIYRVSVFTVGSIMNYDSEAVSMFCTCTASRVSETDRLTPIFHQRIRSNYREKVNCEVSNFSFNSPSKLMINSSNSRTFLERLLTGHKDIDARVD